MFELLVQLSKHLLASSFGSSWGFHSLHFEFRQIYRVSVWDVVLLLSFDWASDVFLNWTAFLNTVLLFSCRCSVHLFLVLFSDCSISDSDLCLIEGLFSNFKAVNWLLIVEIGLYLHWMDFLFFQVLEVRGFIGIVFLIFRSFKFVITSAFLTGVYSLLVVFDFWQFNSDIIFSFFRNCSEFVFWTLFTIWLTKMFTAILTAFFLSMSFCFTNTIIFIFVGYDFTKAILNLFVLIRVDVILSDKLLHDFIDFLDLLNSHRSTFSASLFFKPYRLLNISCPLI